MPSQHKSLLVLNKNKKLRFRFIAKPETILKYQ